MNGPDQGAGSQASNKEQGQERTFLERELTKIDKKINNTAEAIAEGGGAGLTTLTKMLAGLEDQKADLIAQLNAVGEDVE